jgi:hypothetical protein
LLMNSKFETKTEYSADTERVADKSSAMMYTWLYFVKYLFIILSYEVYVVVFR